MSSIGSEARMTLGKQEPVKRPFKHMDLDIPYKCSECPFSYETNPIDKAIWHHCILGLANTFENYYGTQVPDGPGPKCPSGGKIRVENISCKEILEKALSNG